MHPTSDSDKASTKSVERLQITTNECRICFEKCNEVWQIFHPTNEEIPRKLMHFAAVQVEEGDGLPGTICHNCRGLLDVSYNFKCQVERSDAKFRQILMLKEPMEDGTRMYSLSQSVNAAIAEAIADEMECEKNVTKCTELVGRLTNESDDDIANQLNDHHYVSHEDRIIFQMEAPSEQDEPCNLEPSLSNMESQVCQAVDNKHLVINECDENRVVDVLIEKYDELVDSNITSESYKSLPPMIPNNILSQDSKDKCNLEIVKSENTKEAPLSENDEMEKSMKENNRSEEDEEKPLIVRTQREKCPHCTKRFATRVSLERHVEIHKKKTCLRYICYLCNKPFANMEKLKNHASMIHEGAASEAKIEEDYQDSNGDPLSDKHSIKFDNKKGLKLICHICDKRFTYLKSFLTHAKSHPGYEPMKNLALVEKEEGEPVSEESSERGHESEDDDMPLDGLQCTQCGKLFATKRNLKRHLSTHSGLRFNCPSCNKEFSRIDKLKEHEQSKHREEFFASSDSDSEDPDTDNENKTQDGNERRKKQEKTHKRPHKCSMCPKAFAQEQSLTNHMERHKRVKETQKRFLCEVCSKCFAQSGSLVAHMRTHTGVKPYVCNVCSRAFTKSTYLQLHLRTHSGEKPYICQYCSRAFARANTLARHITMHTGEAKYHCQICMKSFRRLTSLNEHTYTHTGQRPYACKICTKRYNNAGSLYAHTKKCKTQQLLPPAPSYSTLPVEEDLHQNGPTSQMILYSQRRLSENSPSLEQITPGAQFVISNPNNSSLKTLPDNIIPQFTLEDPNFSTLASKSYKNSYYTIYPNM